MIRNQRGLTLIELLVTLAILSFVGVLIWSVFFQGYKFSQKSMSRNTIQQEANLVISNLTRIHQTSKQYEISSLNCEITVTVTNRDGSNQTQIYSHPRLCFATDVSKIIIPAEDDIRFKTTIYEKNDSKNSVEVDTFLYRLKGGGI